MIFEITQFDPPKNNDEVRGKGRPKLPEGVSGNRRPVILQSDILHEIIVVLLDRHYSQEETFNYLVKKYTMNKADAQRYWTKAWAIINDKFKNSREQLISKHLAKLWDVHDLAKEKGDFTNARQALNDISKLIGLNSPDKIEHTHHAIKLNFGNPKNNEKEDI